MYSLKRTLVRVYYILFIVQTLAWTSCQKKSGPSVLVIALDKFSSEMTTCSDETNIEKSGLALVCKESIRFTHSYTTSTQPAAAMGSVLTGEYPIKHKLYRSFDRMSPLSLSIAKIAKDNNYVTSFFSGSPFILKKTGLSDYFDLFDDSIAAASNDYDQDFKTQEKNFFQWFNTVGNHNPFFSVIYNSELSKLFKTETDLSGFEKLDEKLHHFFVQMKNENIWDNTYIFVIGLNGTNKFNRYNLNSHSNLHSENTNVTTLIKLPRQKGDEGINWKNDLPISLADLGYTLKCLLGSCAPTDALFPLIDLTHIWKTQSTSEMKKMGDRPLLTQTTDGFTGFHRFSILHHNYNFIQTHTNDFEIFNTLSDKSELTDLKKSKNETLSESKKYLDYVLSFENNIIHAASHFASSYEELVKLNTEYWTSLQDRESILLSSMDEYNPLSYYAIQKSNHLKFSKSTEVKFLNIKRKLLEKTECATLSYKNNLTKDDLKRCTDNLFLQFLLYTHANKLGLNQEKNKLLYSVMKSTYKNQITRLSINLAFNNAWGLYDKSNPLIHPLIFLDSSFFEN